MGLPEHPLKVYVLCVSVNLVVTYIFVPEVSLSSHEIFTVADNFSLPPNS